MAFINVVTSTGFTVDAVRQAAAKVGPREAIDGLLVEAVGQDGDRIHHVTVWQSKAHRDRYEAEQLLPVFQSPGVAGDVAANSEFRMCEAADLYIR